MESIKLKLRHKNRIDKLKAKKNKFWCNICDSNLVGEYSKCSNCGRRNNKKRFKKG